MTWRPPQLAAGSLFTEVTPCSELVLKLNLLNKLLPIFTPCADFCLQLYSVFTLRNFIYFFSLFCEVALTLHCTNWGQNGVSGSNLFVFLQQQSAG